MNFAPTELQLDALLELAHVGCGRAADALSHLVGGRTLVIDVPKAALAELDRGPGVAVHLEVEGELTGELVMVFSEANAQKWCSLLMNAPARFPLTQDERSALAETANIAASAFLNAMASLTGLRLLPSVPLLTQSAHVRNSQPVVVTRFWARGQPEVEGHILFVPDPRSIKRLLSSLGV